MDRLLGFDITKDILVPDITAIFLTGAQFDTNKYSGLLTQIEFDREQDVYLSSLEVNPEIRRQKIGKRYLESKIEEYKAQGRRNIVTHIVGQKEEGFNYQKKLELWYESLGFKIQKYKTKKFGKVSIGVLNLN